MSTWYVCRSDRCPVLENVWLGVSVESPAYYGRIRHLQRTPAAVRFLSCEPLLSALPELPLEGIHWVIVGGESGPGARPMHPQWVRSIREQCRRAGVAFFFKQWGNWRPIGPVYWQHGTPDSCGLPGTDEQPCECDDRSDAVHWEVIDCEETRHEVCVLDLGGGAEDSRAMQYQPPPGSWYLERVARKHDAGRELDGRTYEGMPPPRVLSLEAV